MPRVPENIFQISQMGFLNIYLRFTYPSKIMLKIEVCSIKNILTNLHFLKTPKPSWFFGKNPFKPRFGP